MTVFRPMAPTPVMGGFVLHVDAGRVSDVDMSVEAGIRSIVSSGIATVRDTGGGSPGHHIGREITIPKRNIGTV